MKKNHHYSSLLAGVLLIAALLMSMLVFAQAEQTEPTEDSIMIDLPENTDGRTKKPTATPKPTRTPKPTKTPKPTPTEYPFEPGLREDHEGHSSPRPRFAIPIESNKKRSPHAAGVFAWGEAPRRRVPKNIYFRLFRSFI